MHFLAVAGSGTTRIVIAAIMGGSVSLSYVPDREDDSGARSADSIVAVTVVFNPESPKYAAATEEYENIWSTDGARIVATMEQVTGLKFTEASIKATIFEGKSNSGLPSTPMKLRASYSPDTKRATLIHELGHRLNFQLKVRPIAVGLDSHRVLYLYLYDVWMTLYGKRFADEQMAVESGRTLPVPIRWAGYNYRAAWKWALAHDAEARASLFRDIVRAQTRE